jgi:hypothetical protein
LPGARIRPRAEDDVQQLRAQVDRCCYGGGLELRLPAAKEGVNCSRPNVQ